MNYPSPLIESAVKELSSLPGIGAKTALRLVLHMLKWPRERVENFSQSFIRLVENIKYCSQCFNISENELCSVCSNPRRNKKQICVVEDIRSIIAIENTQQYQGTYHVLGGLISPMDGLGPADLKIENLIHRLGSQEAEEIIMALSATMEGDTTVFYINKKISSFNLIISTIARGISIGDEIEYADEMTLGRSLINRVPYEIKNNAL